MGALDVSRDVEPESVWSYPRPPRVEPSSERVVVRLAGRTLAVSSRALRVLETSHPPAYYIPTQDIAMERLTVGSGTSWCEFKGRAVYWDADVVDSVGWSYPHPAAAYEALRDHIAFYAGRVAATVDGEPVSAQQGDFYGGWVTSKVRGPFKGPPGTSGW